MPPTRTMFVLAATLLACLLAPLTAAAAPRWGSFKSDACTATGKRQYSSRLWDAPGDAMRTCRATGATVRRQRFARPTRCVNQGLGGVWGEFDVVDASCKPRWGAVKRDACLKTGVRQYSARLWDIPGKDWAGACRTAPVTIGGRSVLPSRCKDLKAQGMWGEFDVPDASCPHWGNELGKPGTVRAECVAVGVRKHYARLWDVPAGGDWLKACRSEPQLVAGQQTPRPSSCIWKGPLGMWGEWLVKDAKCTEASLPQDARRQHIASEKLGTLAGAIVAQLDLAHRLSTDPAIKAGLDAGDDARAARALGAAIGPSAAGSDGYLLRTLTVGVTAGVKILIIGGQGEAGVAVDLKGKRPVHAYGSVGYDWGLGLAAGGGVNVGFWVCQNNKIGGDVWGVQFGVDDPLMMASKIGKKAKKAKKGKQGKASASLTVGLWFDYQNVFQGFTLTPSVGVGTNLGGVVYATTAVDGDDTVQCDGSPKK